MSDEPRSTVETHADHWPWRQIGPCVYCECGERLYQGRIPTTQEEARAFGAVLTDVMAAAVRMVPR